MSSLEEKNYPIIISDFVEFRAAKTFRALNWCVYDARLTK